MTKIKFKFFTLIAINQIAVANLTSINHSELKQNIVPEKLTRYIEFAGIKIESGNVENFQIIRANKTELNSLEILSSSHGYHLVNGKVNCKEIHCNHIEIIELNDFSQIKEFDKTKITKKSKMATLQAISLIDEKSWNSNIITLTSWNRQTGSLGNNSAAVWIGNKFNQLSLATSNQEFSVNGIQTNNIIGIKVGLTKPNDWYIVGAHMDSIPSLGTAPGAIDNASGCAGVLEIAKVASLYDFASTIIFICYSGEEQGLHGSYFHVNSIINAGNQSKVKAALTMDMIGYTKDSDYKLLLETSLSNQWLMDIFAQNAAIYAPNLTVFMSTNPFGSDHIPYIQNNMHGILSIDDDWGDYPAYHQSNDLPENLNLNQGKHILTTNMAVLTELAEIIGAVDLIFSSSFD